MYLLQFIKQKEMGSKLKLSFKNNKYSCLLAVALFVHGIAILIQSLDMIIVYDHPLRQYSNGSTIYWLTQGGEWIFYETPIYGQPWKLAFEFPLYQWMAAVIVISTDIDIPSAARLISHVMYLLVLWPAHLICRDLKFPSHLFYIFMCLYLASPLYLFWGRAMMIDSTALFLSVLWLAYFVKNLREQSLTTLLMLAVVTPLAILVKITTFFSFFLLAAVLGLHYLIQEKRYKEIIQWNALLNYRVNVFLVPAVMFFCSLFLFNLWVHFTDLDKLESPMAALFVSDNLTHHVFGSLNQRYKVLSEIIIQQSIPNALGASFCVFIGLLIAAMVSRKISVSYGLLGVLAGVYLLPFYVFTNLHWRHDYHQYANSIFLLFAGALLLSSLYKSRINIGFMTVLLCCGLMVFQFYQVYFPKINRPIPKWGLESIQLAAFIEQNTPQGSGVLVFGADGNPVTPYLSNRKAAQAPFFPEHLAPDIFRELTTKPQKFFGDVELSAIVMCDEMPIAQKHWTQSELMMLSELKRTVLKNSRSKKFPTCDVYLSPFSFGNFY